MVANVDGAEERRLAVRKPPDFFTWGGENAGPAWSPDGKIIACGSRKFSGAFYGNVVGVRVADGVESLLSDGIDLASRLARGLRGFQTAEVWSW